MAAVVRHDRGPATPAPNVTRTLASTLSAATFVLAAVTGCSVFKSNEEAQAILTQRTTGMQAGDFFQRYGIWKKRAERPNGSVDYNWESAVGWAPAGPLGQDDRVCRLRIVANKAGRIESAVIANDNPGVVSTSRCSEMFKADGPGAAIPTGVRP